MGVGESESDNGGVVAVDGSLPCDSDMGVVLVGAMVVALPASLSSECACTGVIEWSEVVSSASSVIGEMNENNGKLIDNRMRSESYCSAATSQMHSSSSLMQSNAIHSTPLHSTPLHSKHSMYRSIHWLNDIHRRSKMTYVGS
jgi:hypothetical protein